MDTLAGQTSSVSVMVSAAGTELSATDPAGRGGDLPLSFAQQRLWLLEQSGDTAPESHVSSRLRLRGELDRDALRRALEGVVARHDALRATFRLVDGEPRQWIAPVEEGGFPLPEHDLGELAEPAATAELGRLAAEADAPFDLERGPLVRGSLVRLGARDHVLLVTTHPLVCDEWSMGILVRELGVLYAAFLHGEADPLPAPPVRYADHVARQRRRVDGELPREREDSWKETLAGAPASLELPTDRPRSARRDHAGDRVRLALDEEVTAALVALAGRHGTTLPTTLLAGWAAVLGRLSGQTELVIGTLAANRERGEVEGLIGLVENILPVRVELSGSPTTAELLGRVEARTREALRSQELPFQRVVELARPAGAAAAAPLFQATFAWREAPGGGPELPGLRVAEEEAPEPRSTAWSDLSLELRERGGGIVGEVEYATALFDRETVERYAGYLSRVLRGMAADETRRVDRLALLPDEERRRVVEEWNRTDAPYPDQSCLHERFEAQAQRTPHAVAVVFEDRELTYGELNGRANRLAHHLRSLGVGPDERVGICVERGLEMVVGLLGVLKAGGAYLPLDPGYPEERLVHMARDSAPVVLLTHGALAARLSGVELPVVALDEDAEWWGRQPDTNPERGGLTPEHLAYVIYTSGSTGRPKGVQLVHRAVSNLVHWYMGATRISERDAVLVVTSFSFHLTQRNLLAPLFAGARLHLAREPFDPRAITSRVAASAISMMSITPTAFQALVEADPERAIGGMRMVVFGGEAVNPRQLARVPHPRPELLNVYGPTEGTGVAASHSIRAEPAGYPGRSVPLGRPIPNARIYVLDGAGEPVPVGVAGELYIGGAGVTRGYRNRAAQTAERFLPDPFGGEPGARLYRTGDLGRWLPDGTVEFMGRDDAQVKVRGFRVELGEIEARLAEHAAVHEAVVAAREVGPGDDRLVAYYVGAPTGAEALRAHLAERLPDYMVPAAYVRLPALPLTANGKLDRRALPAPGGDAFARRGYQAPVGGTETALAEIWSELLGVERVGVHDNFFELGGHSLLAMRVLSRVRQVFAVELPPQTIFVTPTMARMAWQVEDLHRAGLPVLPAVARVERTGPTPLSFAQERLWFLDQLQPGSAFYNIPAALRLRGALDAEALERALGEIVRRHEALRTTFTDRDGTPLQVIAPFGGFRVPVRDLSGLDGAAREAQVRRLASEDATEPFDLAAGPLFRASLLRLDAEEHVLLVCMHHVVSDGWSMGVLFRELSALYGAFREGRTSPLRELPVQYADYALWQRRHLRADAVEGELAYWRERLAGAPALLELPTDHPRPAVQSYRGTREAVELPGELLARLRALGRSEGTTLYMTLLAAFQVLLSRYSGSEDVVVGSPIAGRTRREVEELIGFFVNTLVLRTDLGGDPSFREVLRRVREAALGAYAHQDVPFERLVAELQPERSLSHSPLFQVLFSVTDAGDAGANLPGVSTESVESVISTTQFDLHLAFSEGPGGFLAVMRYSTDLFERRTIARMLGHLEQVLEEVVEDAELRLSRLRVMGAAERRRVLEEWNGTAADYPTDLCSHELFEAQVERTPDAVAAVYGETAVSYGALNTRANRLAHTLREHGVGPDARVAICVERGLEMLVGLLAILKAGGAYVPLDPAYPADRLRFMLEDSAPQVLLTHGVSSELFAGSPVPVIDLAAEAPSWADRPSSNPSRAGLTPDHLCYVIYTSGSTGRPKGVAMPHRPLVNLIAWQEPERGRSRAAVTLQFTTISFDVSFQEIFTTLATGGRLVVASEDARHDPSAVLDLVEQGVVERLSLPFSMLQLVAEEAVERGSASSSLREVQTAGEALRITDPIRQWFGALGVPLHNHYGPSETHVATSFSLQGDADSWPLLPSIGGPVANTQVYVLDAHLSPLPEGVPGELYLAGVCVARGYLDRPDSTAERFVADPFASEAGARMYRTGDRVRWLTDGTLDFLGRVDHQVKIRGFRIEPGEIEAVLRRHPAVAECTVLVREDVPGDKRLVAYVVGEVETESLRDHLRGSLPDYMVPGAFVRLDALPLTPNGKLDRKSLPAPEYEADAEQYVAPRTPTEEVVAGIWAEVLRLERVGVHDNFFKLGGHSLLATRVVSRIRDVLGSRVTVRAVFEAPTVEGLARIVAEASSIGPEERSGEPSSGPASNPSHLLANLDDLSDEELDLLLSTQS